MSQLWNYLSATPPTGVESSTVKACYQFDGPTQGLTDRSGNGHTLQALDNKGAGWISMKATNGCNGYLLSYDDNFLYSANSASLGAVGAATMELVHTQLGLASFAETYNGLVAIGAYPNVESEASNITFSLYNSISSAGFQARLGIFVEVTASANRAVLSDERVPALPGKLSYTAVTRASDGVTYKVYVNGEYVETLTMADAAVGGSSNAVVVGALNAATNGHGGLLVSSLRWSHAELSADQIEETYRGLRMAA